MFERVVRRPVATWMIAIAAAVFGLVSYERLPLNLMPDLYPPSPCAPKSLVYAEEVEAQVSRRIEEALATTPGLVELESRSRAGMSDVILEFAWGTDMNKSSQSIREQLRPRSCPMTPSGRSSCGSTPTSTPSCRSPSRGPTPRLRRHAGHADHGGTADQAAPRSHGRGGQRPASRWVVPGNQDRRSRGLDDRPGSPSTRSHPRSPRRTSICRRGDLEGTEYLVRTVERTTVEDIQAIQIKRADGVVVPLTNWPPLRRPERPRGGQSIGWGGSRRARNLQVCRREHCAALAQDPRTPRCGPAERADDWDAPATIADRLPDGMKMAVLEGKANFIEPASTTCGRRPCLARSWRCRSCSCSSATSARPSSSRPPFRCRSSPRCPPVPRRRQPNLMSLGSLALGIGMLVDNAIGVQLENIHVQRERGLDRIEAAITGTRTVAGAVVTSTLTTVCVFLPIAFVEGVAGQLFGDLAMAVVFSLLASLVVALFCAIGRAQLNWTGPGTPVLRPLVPADSNRSDGSATTGRPRPGEFQAVCGRPVRDSTRPRTDCGRCSPPPRWPVPRCGCFIASCGAFMNAPMPPPVSSSIGTTASTRGTASHRCCLAQTGSGAGHRGRHRGRQPAVVRNPGPVADPRITRDGLRRKCRCGRHAPVPHRGPRDGRREGADGRPRLSTSTRSWAPNAGPTTAPMRANTPHD